MKLNITIELIKGEPLGSNPVNGNECFSYERPDVVSVGTQTILKFPYLYEGELPGGQDPVKVSFDC